MIELILFLVGVVLQAMVLGCGLMLWKLAATVVNAHRLARPDAYAKSLRLYAVLPIVCGLMLFGYVAGIGSENFFLIVWAGLNIIALLVGGLFLLQSATVVSRKVVGSQYRLAANLRSVAFALFVIPAVIATIPMLILGVLLAIAGVFLAAARRRTDQGAVLWALAIAVENNFSLAEELESIADGLSRRQRRLVLKLADRLQDGQSLATALDSVPGVIPHFAVLAIQVGEKQGTLPSVVREAAVRFTSRSSKTDLAASSPTLSVLYLAVVPLFASLMFCGLMIYIVPKYKKMFADFGVQLPTLTLQLISVADFLVAQLYLLFPVFVIPAVGMVLLAIYYIRGWGESEIPWIGGWFRRCDVPAILRTLSSTVALNRPLTDALAILSTRHRRKAVRAALQVANEKCRGGDDCWYALRDAGLLTGKETAVLRSAQRVGNLPWALEQLAETAERRLSYRWQIVAEFAQPAVVIIVGLVVGIIYLAFFSPLVSLIQEMA